MACRNQVHGYVVAILAMVALSTDWPRADATPTVLASASFEGDPLGAVARPDGPPTVAEEVWDASTYSGGVSEVVAAGSTRRYRISDLGSVDEVKGILLPFSSVASSGDLTLEAVATAEQTGSDGGLLCANNPEEDEWSCIIGFGSDGKFQVHGSGTSTSYSANARYLFRITIHLGPNPTADYLVLDVVSNNTVLESTGHELPEGVTIGSMSFRTDVADIGAFTVDALSAEQ